MFSERALAAASLSYAFPCFLKIIPFDWDWSNSRLSPASHFRMAFNILHLLNMWVHAFFLLASYWVNERALLLSPWRLLLHVSWLSIFLIALAFSSFSYSYRHDLADLVNQMFTLLRVECVQEGDPSVPDWCERLLKLFMLNGKAFALFAALIFFMEPMSSRYFYGFFQRMTGTGDWFFLPFGLWQFMNALVFWQSILFHVDTVLLFLFGTVTWFNVGRTQNRGGEPSTPLSQLRSFKRLKLLSIHFNFCFRHTMVPTLQFLGVLFPVVCFHVIISFHDRIGLVITSCLFMISFSSLVFTTFTWPVAAQLHTKSGKVLKNIKAQRRDLSREVMAMRSIRIECGTINFVQRYTTYKLLGMVLYSTGKSLLIFKH